MFRETASGLGLADDLIYDGMTMASELAANTLYAQQNVQFERAARHPVAGAPELWLYLRHAAGRWELVCKAFDSLTGWTCGSPPTPGRAGPGAVDGRGLARLHQAAHAGVHQAPLPRDAVDRPEDVVHRARRQDGPPPWGTGVAGRARGRSARGGRG